MLQRSGVESKDVVANALFLSASCFVVPDGLLLIVGRADLLAIWARAAGPLALFTMVWALQRSSRAWRVTLWATLAMALPALAFVR